MILADWASREDIQAVMFDEDIYDRTNPDGTRRKEDCNIFAADLSDYYFIAGYVDLEIASLFVVKDDLMHFWVLKPYRRHARDLLKASFDMWPHRVKVSIPTLYQSVINFAKNYGFEEAGIEKDAFRKNGVLYDKQILTYEE